MDLAYCNLPNNTVLSLIAPTASGKTELAYRLYETGRFELISVDSALIYQDMDIGTAKPTQDELSKYPHHLVNIIKPTDTYSVANFVCDVKTLIDKAHHQGKIPLLVGGTMMYYMALFEGLSAVPQTDTATRQKVMAWLSDKGIGDLYQHLKTHDPKICERLKVSDTQRITRAVEVHLQTGIPMSVWQATPKNPPCQTPSQYWLSLSVEPDRAWLHERIARRLEMMWQRGLVGEVVGLLKKYPDLTPQMPAMRCVGYRQVLEYLAITGHEVMEISDGWQQFAQNIRKNTPLLYHDVKPSQKIPQNLPDMACQDMKNKALYATRQLAKRQATWQRSLARLITPTITDKSQEVKSPAIVSFSCIQEVEKCLLGRVID